VAKNAPFSRKAKKLLEQIFMKDFEVELQGQCPFTILNVWIFLSCDPHWFSPPFMRNSEATTT